MNMQRKPLMCGSIIIGLFFLFAAISIFVNIIFGINLPFGRIFWGIVLLYLGITLITGTSRHKINKRCSSSYHGATTRYANWAGSAHIIFDAAQALQNTSASEFSTVMGSTELDLTHITPEIVPSNRLPLTIDVSTVFGKTVVKIPKETSVRIDVRSAFAGTELPDQTNISFGSHTYFSHQDADAIHVHLSTSTVFGALEIIRL